jgi:hypothetical protein
MTNEYNEFESLLQEGLTLPPKITTTYTEREVEYDGLILIQRYYTRGDQHWVRWYWRESLDFNNNFGKGWMHKWECRDAAARFMRWELIPDHIKVKIMGGVDINVPIW